MLEKIIYLIHFEGIYSEYFSLMRWTVLEQLSGQNKWRHNAELVYNHPLIVTKAPNLVTTNPAKLLDRVGWNSQRIFCLRCLVVHLTGTGLYAALRLPPLVHNTFSLVGTYVCMYGLDLEKFALQI